MVTYVAICQKSLMGKGFYGIPCFIVFLNGPLARGSGTPCFDQPFVWRYSKRQFWDDSAIFEVILEVFFVDESY
jgi:hypothetical protein